MNSTPVIGRFAPSPTGDLHFGSLVCAVGSYLETKKKGGKWLLRIEDIDPPREVSGSAERIIHDLAALGLRPDGDVLYQSRRTQAYQEGLQRLLQAKLAYPCACTRKDLPANGIYPGTCRKGILDEKQARAIRFQLNKEVLDFNDRVQGSVSELRAHGGGDFIIHRADGLFAYQLAVVIDDDYQGVTQVVRGADLLDSTIWQIQIQHALGIKTPEYLHLPLVISADGKKLSKQLDSDPVKTKDPASVVTQALQFLGQSPPSGLHSDSLWSWALEHWDYRRIPHQKATITGKALN